MQSPLSRDDQQESRRTLRAVVPRFRIARDGGVRQAATGYGVAPACGKRSSQRLAAPFHATGALRRGRPHGSPRQPRCPGLRPLLPMHPGTAAVIPRTSGALLLSAVEANVAEFRCRTPARDDVRAPRPPGTDDSNRRPTQERGGWRSIRLEFVPCGRLERRGGDDRKQAKRVAARPVRPTGAAAPGCMETSRAQTPLLPRVVRG
jgi:hypothetical protein